MLVYRLIHFKDIIPDIDIGVKRRNKELCKPYIQLFYGSESQREIEQTLERFLKSKNERKSTSIENVLLPLIINLTAEYKGNPLPTAKLWDTITENIEGESNGPNEFHSVEYGKLYRDWIVRKIKDKFGPTPVRLTGGKRAWRFDIDKLQRIAVSYSTDIKIETTLRISLESDTSDTSDTNDTTLATPLHTKDEEIEHENDKNEVPMITRVPSLPSNQDSSRMFYKCYHDGCVCGHTCEFHTDSEQEYQKHGALDHVNNPLLYPSSYELEKFGLTPQGKPWERRGN